MPSGLAPLFTQSSFLKSDSTFVCRKDTRALLRGTVFRQDDFVRSAIVGATRQARQHTIGGPQPRDFRCYYDNRTKWACQGAGCAKAEIFRLYWGGGASGTSAACQRGAGGRWGCCGFAGAGVSAGGSVACAVCGRARRGLAAACSAAARGRAEGVGSGRCWAASAGAGGASCAAAGAAAGTVAAMSRRALRMSRNTETIKSSSAR